MEQVMEKGWRKNYTRLGADDRNLRARPYISLHLLRRHISPFQSSGSGLTERKISMCHLPPPQGSMTSAATTSTRISENNRPSGSPSRWYAGSSHPNVGYSINVRNKSYP